MKIIYNPKDGAPITQFISDGVMLDPHYPDGYQMPDGKTANGLMQYNDFTADELVETYMFLRELTLEQAQKIVDRPEEPAYKCDFPKCDFSTTTKVALIGHQKKHAKDVESANTPVVASNVIPVAGGKKVLPLAERQKLGHNNEDDLSLPNGADKDGVEWYGEGEQVENKSNQQFGGMRRNGQGHFVG